MFHMIAVDDELKIAKGLEELCDWSELSISFDRKFTDSRQAMTYLREHPVDIALLDINMPYLSGIDILKNIQQEHLQTVPIVLSGYDDFENVRSCFLLGAENYLLKPINQQELFSILNQVISNLQKKQTLRSLDNKNSSEGIDQYIIHSMLLGVLRNRELQEIKNRMHFQFNAPYYAVALILFYEPVDITEYKKLLTDHLNALQDNCQVIVTAQNELALLYSLEQDGEQAEQYIKEHLQKMTSLLHQDFFASIGSVVDGYRYIQSSMYKAKKMLTYSLMMPQNSIIGYQKQKKEKTKITTELKTEIRKLDGIIYHAAAEEIHEKIDLIFEQIQNTPTLSPDACKTAVAEIIYNTFGTLGNMDDHQTIVDESFLLNILDLSTLEQMQNQIKNQIDAFLLQKETAPKQNPIIDRIIDYVEQNYGRDISLNTLASMFFFHPKYISRIFKQETGRKFSDYLCEFRIAKAKELLIQTDEKLFDIACQVGFSDPSYFANSFKKIVGCYPSAYRKKFLQNLE